FTTGGFTLIIDNWTGTANSTIFDGSPDHLIFNSDQTSNLNSFWFTGYAPGATQFDLGGGYYEITPTVVPEPSTYAAGLLTLVGIGYLHRNQLRRLIKSKAARNRDS